MIFLREWIVALFDWIAWRASWPFRRALAAWDDWATVVEEERHE